MDRKLIKRRADYKWLVERTGKMRVDGVIYASEELIGGMDDKVEIYGTEGVIKADLTFGSPISVYSRPGYSYCIEKTDNTLGWTRPAVDEFFNLGYVKELAYVVDSILQDSSPTYGASGELGLACVEIIDAMYRSVKEAKTIQGSW